MSCVIVFIKDKKVIGEVTGCISEDNNISFIDRQIAMWGEIFKKSRKIIMNNLNKQIIKKDYCDTCKRLHNINPEVYSL